MKIDDQLRDAILRMPVKEKDKLLLRLVAKDDLLVKKLAFDLLEKGATTDDRAEEIREVIEKRLINGSGSGQTPGYLLMDLRYCNPLITEHVKITKDKIGEVQITLYMLRRALEINQTLLKKFPPHRFDTLAPYFVRRVLQMIEKTQKLHEDFHFEIRREIEQIVALASQFPALQSMIEEAGLEDVKQVF